MLVRSVGTVHRGLEDPLAQVAVVETGQQGLLRGVDDDNGVWGLLATRLGIFGALGDVGIGKASQVFLLVHPHHGIVGGSGQVVAPLLLQVGDAQVDLLHPRHLVLGQQGTLAHKLLVDLLEQLLFLARQRIVLLVVDLLDALEERLVERYLVFEIGQHRHHLLLNLAQFRRLVSLGEGEKHAAHAVEQAVALVEGQDGVLERGRILILHDLLDVVTLVLDSRLEGRQIVRDLDLAEVGRAEGHLTLLQQRVLALSLLAGSQLHRQGRCDSDSHNCLTYFHITLFIIVAKIVTFPQPSNKFRNIYAKFAMYHSR